MGLYCALTEYKLGHVALSRADYDFISSYVGFLVSRNLARIDFDWFDRQEKEFNEVGQFLAASLSEAGNYFATSRDWTYSSGHMAN
jgi:hypothetical protein